MSRPRMHMARTLALAILATTAGASRVGAAPTPIAVWLDGHDAARLRGAIVAALPRGYAPVSPRNLARALPSVSGRRAADRPLAARLAALAERLKVHLALYARVDGKTHELVLLLGRSGVESIERRISPRAIKLTLAEMLRAPESPPPSPPLAEASAPPAPAPQSPAPPSSAPQPAAPSPSPAPPSPPPPIVRSTAKTAPRTRPTAPIAAATAPSPLAPATIVRAAEPLPAGPLFSIALDGGVAARRLQYNQAITQNLPTYSAAAVPWIGVRAALYPAAHTGVPFLRDLGAFGDFGHSLYQQSTVAGSTSRISATWSTFDAGLRERIRFAVARPGLAPTLGIALAYGRAAYVFDEGGIELSETPSVDYRYLRPAVDGRISFGRVTLFADFGYRAVLSAGYVGSRFPHAQVGGLDVGAGIAIALPRDLELRLTGQYARFFYDLRPQPGDPYIAGGALDEFGVGELALAYGF